MQRDLYKKAPLNPFKLLYFKAYNKKFYYKNSRPLINKRLAKSYPRASCFKTI
jgi:hypothetical protein